MADLIGQTLRNRYRIEASLGRGGMAEVYKVWDQERATYLALKLLREDLAQDPIFIRRFKREAQTLAKLQHPNIVRFYSLDQDDLLAFILMDYVNGTSLRAEIFRSQGKPFSNERILEIISPICSALHYAHRQGMVHCDIKPGNILIDKSGRVLVSDFGIARMSESATATLVGAGTPAYMPPEQARGENPTPQTDIYSLGVVLFEMLTGGERPFTGENAQITGSTNDKIRWEQINLKPPSLRKINPALSPDLEAIVRKCLEKEPQRRFNNTMELLKALETANENQPTLTEKRGSAWRKAVEQSLESVSGNAPVIPLRQERKRRGVIVISILLVGILAVIAFGALNVLGHAGFVPLTTFTSSLPMYPLNSTSEPTSTLPPSVTPDSTAPHYITAQVRSVFVNLRKYPYLESELQNPKRHFAGEIMIVLGQDPSNQWFRVQASDGETGWIYKDWLDSNWLNVPTNLSGIPIFTTTTIPLPILQGGVAIAHPSNPGGPGPAVELTGDANSGQQIFAANCVSCHATEGKGGNPNPGSTAGTIPALNPINPALKNPDKTIFATNLDLFIEHGSTPAGSGPTLSMPPWGDKGTLTSQQIADVIAYIISLNSVTNVATQLRICVVEASSKYNKGIIYYLTEFHLSYDPTQIYSHCVLGAGFTSCTTKIPLDSYQGAPLIRSGYWLVMPVASQETCIPPGLWVMDASH